MSQAEQLELQMEMITVQKPANCLQNKMHAMSHISFMKANILMGINCLSWTRNAKKITHYTEWREEELYGIISVWEASSWRRPVWGSVLQNWEWVSLLPWDVPFSNNPALWTAWWCSGRQNINLMPLLFVNITLGERLRGGCLPSRRRACRLIAEATGGLSACRTA